MPNQPKGIEENTPNTELKEKMASLFYGHINVDLDEVVALMQTYAKQEVERVLLSLLEDTTFADVTAMLTEEVVLVSVIEQHLKEIPAKE